MDSPARIPTDCLLCGPDAPAAEIFPAHIPATLSGADFSARKTHRRWHYRLVRCDRCGLVRANPIFDAATITHLYEASGFTYGDETQNLARAYRQAARSILRQLPPDARIIDVGCGNGFYLQTLWDHGCRNLVGYEPSRDAMAKAPPEIRPLIQPVMFETAALPPASADLVCCFHVIDHVRQPDVFLQTCATTLKPGGFIHGVDHDLAALPHRIFGERSVAYDIQHIYLFDRTTIRRLLEKCGFQVLAVKPLWNSFTLGYLAHMAPLPAWLKWLLQRRPWGGLRLTLPVGNMSFTARKPM